jgi:hypothetical protein
MKRAAAQPDIINNRLMLNCYFVSFGIPGSASARRRRGFAEVVAETWGRSRFFCRRRAKIFVGAGRKMQFAAIAFAVF